MNPAIQIAKHLRDVHFGGNWTCSNLKDQLEGIGWQEATTQVHSLNTIAALAYHINYYVSAILGVMRGGPLDAHDKYSFNHPPIQSDKDWEKLLGKIWDDAESLAVLIEKLPESRLDQDFSDPKYGSYYRNLHGMVEHTHYHLGQIAIIKKMIRGAS